MTTGQESGVVATPMAERALRPASSPNAQEQPPTAIDDVGGTIKTGRGQNKAVYSQDALDAIERAASAVDAANEGERLRTATCSVATSAPTWPKGNIADPLEMDRRETRREDSVAMDARPGEANGHASRDIGRLEQVEAQGLDSVFDRHGMLQNDFIQSQRRG
jgi:hypothetical protein